MVSEAEVKQALKCRHGLLYAFVKHMESVSDSPLVYALGGALSLAATLVPVGIDIGVQPSTLWVMVVGGTATRKTVQVEEVTNILTDIAPNRLFPNVQSTAALVESLRENEQRFLWPLGELGDFFSGTTTGHHRDTLREALMGVYDGTPLSYSTKNSTTKVGKPRLSIFGGVTPSHLEQHTLMHDWNGGFLNRWTIFTAIRERNYTPRPTLRPYEPMLRDAIRELNDRCLRMGECEGWEQNAALAWDAAWQQDTQAGLALTERQRAATARCQNTGVKAAMLYAMTAGVAYNQAGLFFKQPWRIDYEAAEFGWCVAQMHKKSVLKILERIATSDYERRERAVLDAFGEEGERVLDLGSILRLMSPRDSKRRTMEVIETLLAHGGLHKVGDGAANGGTYYSRHPPAPVVD